MATDQSAALEEECCKENEAATLKPREWMFACGQ